MFGRALCGDGWIRIGNRSEVFGLWWKTDSFADRRLISTRRFGRTKESIKLEKDPSQCKLFDQSSGTNEYVLQFALPEIAIRKSFKHLCKY
jgi:hypothetical protein